MWFQTDIGIIKADVLEMTQTVTKTIESGKDIFGGAIGKTTTETVTKTVDSDQFHFIMEVVKAVPTIDPVLLPKNLGDGVCEIQVEVIDFDLFKVELTIVKRRGHLHLFRTR